ncbi:hypothetical protein A1O1_04189 [Capronia coronata CBS 617.96]|uniref:FCP1 homology domain-containing protein n=1 Tax=Capronia coronata CBS 617.96 TaxID=1182541 RepID=W9YDX4_9EURO|nr:uncharacterized protein A1O1_04189 [Capronia coronata CBS 617.96]EXJ91082.1 hypothetical protein A1O1_04189 [Capronia coronata CBS 617.96]
MTEKPKQPSLVKIPSRSSSHQKQSETTSPTPPVSTIPNEEPASPRRGSKRSLLSRSRNASRSSRKSTKAARTGDDPKEPVPPLAQSGAPRSDKKPRSGLLALFNCCLPHELPDDTKSDDPDVSAKKVKIQPTPQRASRPPEQSEVIGNEKALEGRASAGERVVEGRGGEEEKAGLSEKRAIDVTGPGVTREDVYDDKVSPVSGGNGSASATTQPNPGDQELAHSGQLEPLQTTTAIAPESSTKPELEVTAATPLEPELSTDAQSFRGPSDRDSDVDMSDAPPSVPSDEDEPVDEPPQPAELQPQVPLPPPPPLEKRQEQIATKEVPAVSEEVAEKQTWLLPPLEPRFKGRKCLVLDLDETLVHSSFKILNQADFTIPVEIEGQYHNVYVIKRPGVDAFMKRVGELYEVVVFTASVSKYGDPLLDQLDIHHVVHHRLFRESCYNHQGNYVKDLSQVGRDLKEVIIIDNSPTSYIFHPQHAVPISSWFSDAHDNELLDLIPVLEDLAGPQVRDVSLVLDVAL